MNTPTDVNSILAFELDNITNINLLKDARKIFETKFIYQKMLQNNWSVTRTARELGISHSNLRYIIDKLGLKEITTKK